MSDRKQALQDLLAKIEAGEFDPKSPRRVSWSSQQHRQFYDTAERGGIPVGICGDAARAYRGSLDAAKALHEAVLPEWSGEARISGFGGGQAAVWHPMKAPHHGGTIRVDNADPARAWLCAILKALIAQEDGK